MSDPGSATPAPAIKGHAEITALTGLRGLAAIFVTLYHYYGNLDVSLTDPLHVAIRRGYLNVDLFFILSGLVMAMTYAEGFRTRPGFGTWRSFMLRRVARIVPLYLVTLIACLIVAYLAYGRFSSSFGGFPVSVDEPVPEILFNLLLVQSWSLAQSALVPAWSISTEWAAYFLFPGFVVLMLGGSPWRTALGCVAAVAMLAGAVWITAHDGLLHGGPLDASSGQVPGALLRCLAGFALGMAVYRVAQWRLAALAFTDGFGAALFVLLATLWLFGPSDFLIYPLLPLVVLALAGNRGRISRLLSARPLYLLGVLSYAIYLLHYQLAGIIHWLEGALAARIGAGPGTLLAGLLVYATLLSAATVSYLMIEVPGRRLVRALERRRGRQQVAPALS